MGGFFIKQGKDNVKLKISSLAKMMKRMLSANNEWMITSDFNLPI
jgi:hypothetical protein